MTRKRPDEPDDGVPVKLTPRRMQAKLDALALDVSRVGLELYRLGKYTDHVHFGDLAEEAQNLARALAEFAGQVAIGQVAITAGRDDQVVRERYPLFAARATEDAEDNADADLAMADFRASGGIPIEDLDAFLAEGVKEAEAAKAPEPPRTCRICGTTDADHIRTDAVGWHWVEPDLCHDCGIVPRSRATGKGKSFDVFRSPAGGMREFVGTIKARGKSAAIDAARAEWPDHFRGLADMEIAAVLTPKTAIDRDRVYGTPQPEVLAEIAAAREAEAEPTDLDDDDWRFDPIYTLGLPLPTAERIIRNIQGTSLGQLADAMKMRLMTDIAGVSPPEANRLLEIVRGAIRDRSTPGEAEVSELDIYHGKPPVEDALAEYPKCEGYKPSMPDRAKPKPKAPRKPRAKRAAIATESPS